MKIWAVVFRRSVCNWSTKDVASRSIHDDFTNNKW